MDKWLDNLLSWGQSNKEEYEKMVLERGRLAQEFLEGELWNNHLKPHLMGLLDNSYPEPKERGWQEKYINAKAEEKVIKDLTVVLVAWKSERSKLLQDKKDEREHSIEDA